MGRLNHLSYSSRCVKHARSRVARIGPHRVFFSSNEALEQRRVHMQRELRRPGQLVTKNREVWMEAWHEFFGRRNSPESS